ncbi:restriction modification system DNA specificity domain [Caldicellulosiruptor obsidiansis OB47]|uniref:Restriction modification system DNA specificity domain n=1 Tax=Caldicellulosiruptor obsidiansis (strain ATCC BAA-2073 / JCM 16842 / OB47) TaxID=608506 RepID=D9TJD1_CALOO|nr:restriction modification system DNA specificity domain [Caldicellulosiruptor obsidiansis OB47]
MGHNGVIKGSDGGNVKVANNAEFPKEWTIVSLERDCVLISGLRPKGGASDEGIPSLGGEHITLDGRINFSDVNAKYIPEKFFKIMTKGKAEENDILINKDGANTGKVAILKKKFYKDIAINEHLFILRSKKLFVQQYLFYWLFSRFGQKQITDRITGSAQPGLSSTFIKNFLVPRPPLSEQRKIAEILETIDNAIEKTDAIIEKYKRIKQGLMQDLLTKGIDENWQIRNEKTHKFKDSLLGRIPEEWKVVKLKDVADIRLSNVDKKTDLKGKIIQLCNYLEVYQNDYIIKGMNFMHASATNNEIKKFKISKGDVIITKDSEEYNDIAKPAYVRDEIENLICGYHLALIKPLNNINGLFLSKVLSFRNVNIYFQQRANGITRFGLTKETITGAIIPLPLIPEQERIATILSQIDEVIEKEQAYKEKLERIKKGLMEDLLTGKVRVNHLLIEEEGKDDN